MDKALDSIISEIPVGCIFDSHFVINQLIRNHSDAYLEFAGKFSGSSITPAMHGHIGQKIDKHSSVDQQGKSWSENIHTNASECTCWRKK
jgi:hypothetical protein